MPVIITLFGDQQTAAVSHLKDYIGAEASDKHDVIVGRNQIQAMTAKGIPEQTHSYDCGVYLIAYIEEFAKNPAGFVTKILTGELDKEKDFESFDASGKRARIRNELLELYEKQVANHKSTKSGTKFSVP